MTDPPKPVDGGGAFKFNDGAYEGEWSGGLRHGHGVMRYDNGNTYDGEWRLDVSCGRGKALYAGGIAYEGEFEGGKKHGWQVCL